LNLITTEKYRIRIQTADGKLYISEYVPIQNAPPIDSIHWQRTTDEIKIFASTHDPLNNTRYYRWQYEETWEINSAFPSFFEYKNGFVDIRSNPMAIFPAGEIYRLAASFLTPVRN